MTEITREEEQIIFQTIRTGNYDLFTEYFFKLPYSGTWFTPEDNVDEYIMLYDVWKAMGKPDESFEAEIEGVPVSFRLAWDPYYQGEPIFLLPHGFRTLPWIRRLLSPTITRGLATTGTGSGKTCNVAIMALTYCAIMPGFRFLNLAPSQSQAALMLGEIEKWAGNTKFAKFIRKGQGSNPLWTEKPYPTITIEVVQGQPSTFICQTTGKRATNILGQERDWINIDEAQLIENITEIEPILVTRLRGTRVTGLMRWSKLTWITNPGRNPELVALMEDYKELKKASPENVEVLEDVSQTVNIYLTKRQIEEQRRSLSQREQDRWLSGMASAVFDDAEISEYLLDNARSKRMDEIVDRIGLHDDEFGLLRYEIPREDGHDYIVVGDTGKTPLHSMTTQNVPCVMVFDVTDFLHEPSRIVAFYWIHDATKYDRFTDTMKRAMMRYQARGYYDAGNIQTAFEDVGPFSDLPMTTPVYFSGRSGIKKWALGVVVMMLEAGMMQFPYIKGMWYQARIYDPGSKKIADDIITCLLVFARVLAIEGTLWTRFTEYFKIEDEDGAGRKEEEEDYEERQFDEVPIAEDRHARLS